jgi:hypothetical protein
LTLLNSFQAIVADHDRDPPPEDDTNRLVWSFCNLADQLADRCADPAKRREVLANRRDLLAAFDRLSCIEVGLLAAHEATE